MTQKEYNKEKGLPLDFKDPKYDNKLSREYYLKCEQLITERFDEFKEFHDFGLVPIEILLKGCRYKELIYQIFTYTHIFNRGIGVNSIDKYKRFYDLEKYSSSKMGSIRTKLTHVNLLKDIQNEYDVFNDVWYDLCRYKNKKTKKLTPKFKTVTKEELDKRRNKNIDYII